jgi:ubiquinone/menaquinone biosynthesis C-methylase UbiE
VAWILTGLFLLGFFLSSVGSWTGPILGAWFVGTQKPRRGFIWMVLFAFIPTLVFDWRKFPLTGPDPALAYLGWTLLAAVLGVLPFTFHRFTSPRLPGLISTLPLPFAALALKILTPPAPYAAASITLLHPFFSLWLASTLVWAWNLEFRAARVRLGLALFSVFFLSALALQSANQFLSTPMPQFLPAETLSWISLAACAAFIVFALLNPERHIPWASRPQTLAQLRSPFTGSPLKAAQERGHELLASPDGEQFPVRNGIPVFLKPEDLTGDNGKYNHLYETIGGFYDDTQRVACALKGLDLDSYFANYMSLLQANPGDSILETSVGTGLNFKYLPSGCKLSGLDLSGEMLARCQTNLRRWGLEADLYLGNAESLPFADSTFDAVYTAGAFNFFSDRAKAVREMIRVAKPGAHLMIEDETEEYVKSTYEKIPYTSKFYGDREKPVTVPIDLVPPEMEEIRLEMLKEGKFYAITFRKPHKA